MLFQRHPKIEGREQGKNVSLDECHQQFQESHEYGECNRYRCNGCAQHSFHVAEDKDQAHKAQHDDMPGADVSKETDHEDERLGKDPHELDNRHERDREF